MAKDDPGTPEAAAPALPGREPRQPGDLRAATRKTFWSPETIVTGLVAILVAFLIALATGEKKTATDEAWSGVRALLGGGAVPLLRFFYNVWTAPEIRRLAEARRRIEADTLRRKAERERDEMAEELTRVKSTKTPAKRPERQHADDIQNIVHEIAARPALISPAFEERVVQRDIARPRIGEHAKNAMLHLWQFSSDARMFKPLGWKADSKWTSFHKRVKGFIEVAFGAEARTQYNRAAVDYKPDPGNADRDHSWRDTIDIFAEHLDALASDVPDKLLPSYRSRALPPREFDEGTSPAQRERFISVRTDLEAFAARGRVIMTVIAHRPPPPQPRMVHKDDLKAFLDWHTAFVAYIATNIDSAVVVGRYAAAAERRGDQLSGLREGVEIWTVFLEITASELREMDVRPEPRTASGSEAARTVFPDPTL